jgi:chromosome partitioning protein
MSGSQAHIIVFANEKGGTGKSTTAVHTGVALSAMGHKVAMLDLDPRQRTVTLSGESRRNARRRNIDLPPIFRVFDGTREGRFGVEPSGGMDFLIVDTPGRGDAYTKYMCAQRLVTRATTSSISISSARSMQKLKVKRLSFTQS